MAFKIRTRNAARLDELVVRSMVEDPEAGVPMPEDPEVEVPMGDVLADTAEDIIGDGSEGSQFLGIFIGNLDTKFFFDRHEGLQEVEGIEPEVVIKRFIRCQHGFVQAQFLLENSPDLSHNLRLIDKSVHNQ
jgi:hypothetical protein